ncbi:MAG: response regulator [Steroidobacteraceae bacterium]
MRILLVEDDELLGKAIRTGLEQQDYAVDWVTDGVAGEIAATTTEYSALLLDLGLPRQDGIMLLKKLRASGNTVPVIMITARDALAERIAGLDSGADDFIVKPFDLQELGARLRAVMRRAEGRACAELIHGGIKIDPAARTVSIDEQLVPITAREFAILKQLLEHKGKVRSKQQLQDALYDWNSDVDSNTVEVHVHHLRRKLGRDLIKTRHGMGYIINDAD